MINFKFCHPERKRRISLWMALGFFGLAALRMTTVVHAETIPPECRVLPEHVADADVAFQPGVGANGKEVAPADLGSSANILGKNETIVVPLTIDMAERLDIDTKGAEMKSTLGFIEVAPNGHVTYNGKDMTSQVYIACGRNPDKSDILRGGQSEQDILK